MKNKEIKKNGGKSNEEVILDMLRQVKVLRVRDILEAGLHPETIRRMQKKGVVIRVSRGLYIQANAIPTQYDTLIEVFKKVPKGVACLLTALRFHEIGTQDPREVWVALSRTSKTPKMTYPRIRVFKFSGEALTTGIEVHKLAGVDLRVYGVAKTIADCFKYRGKIGPNIAVEALKDALRQRKCTVDDLWRYARICRVTKIIQPYLEAIV